MLRTQRHHQLLIRFLLAAFVQDAHVCLTSVERFASLAQSACESVVDKGEFENAFEGFEHGHLAAASRGSGGIGLAGGFLGGNGRGGLFSVRLWEGGSVRWFWEGKCLEFGGGWGRVWGSEQTYLLD